MLERVPGDRLDYKPHEKSMPLGRLAQHLSELPGWGVMMLSTDEFDYAPEGGAPYTPPAIKSVGQLVEAFDKGVSEMRAALQSASDETMLKPWSLKATGKAVFTMPKAAVLRSMIMNHMIHHRAQLGVYLRMNGVAIPGVYGPSADDMAAGAGQ